MKIAPQLSLCCDFKTAGYFSYCLLTLLSIVYRKAVVRQREKQSAPLVSHAMAERESSVVLSHLTLVNTNEAKCDTNEKSTWLCDKTTTLMKHKKTPKHKEVPSLPP